MTANALPSRNALFSRNALLSRNALRAALPAVTLLLLLGTIFWIQPRAMTPFGINLMLNLAVPIVLATMAQLFVMTVNDLDLSIGGFVGLSACIGATWLNQTPLLGVAALAACILAYAGLGALIHLRRLPSIVVTLGMSFVWLGLAVILLPTPGGAAPGWLKSLMAFKPPYLPFPILASIVIALLVHVGLMRTSYGAILRGFGGNPQAMRRSGWSSLRATMTMYALAGLFGVLSGLALLGISTSADANIALRYTLLSIAGAILGGCEFTGGRVSPVGAVLGALTLALAGSALTFLRISPDWQVGAQGAILIAVLALRAFVVRKED
ncbi:ABC transporter permease [Azospirillum sp. SYSU D00513]|uniref:ABC transporter permease n=1 Tax=Azospirillum sp. SYSU D00513 TaxID=2812561 RepID=UPI001A96E38E|nr:ABC transporter permease [Azospirillum sp. SYSU D00513]